MKSKMPKKQKHTELWWDNGRHAPLICYVHNRIDFWDHKKKKWARSKTYKPGPFVFVMELP